MSAPAPLRHIGCAVDFSPSSRAALHFAARLAFRDRAQLTLIHVVPIPMYYLADAFVPMSPATGFAIHDAARAELAKWQTEAQLDGAREVVGFVATGTASSEILRWASEHQPDALVVGQRGHAGLEALLLGSVADRVVRSATCPVVVVPAAAAKA